MTDDKIKLIFEKCTPDKANDKKLPSDSYVVSYEEDKELKYELAAIKYGEEQARVVWKPGGRNRKN